MTLPKFSSTSKKAISAAVFIALALLSACGEPSTRTVSTPMASPAPSVTSTATAVESPSVEPSLSPPASPAVSAGPSVSATTPAEALPSPALDENGNPLPRLIKKGTVTFQTDGDKDAVQLPLIGVETTYSADSGDAPPSITPPDPLPTVAFRIPAEQAGKLAAFWMNLGYGGQGMLIIAPKDWIASGATVGANGSFGINLVNPVDNHEGLSTMDTAGGCQGCAISSIGSYFPKLSKWAEDQSFPGDPLSYLNYKMIGEHEIEYELKNKNNGYVTRGTAYERHEGGAWFGGIELSISKDRNDLAQTMLSYYEFMNEVKEMN
ncbi:DUF4850 domain-containing protein [Gorillibacterium massiliense]|uniref:DUF4850 domain-containing protein n=1 Tax=Gorillibacterium massiliense TaxID=1280390 RepID=UPI0004B912A6|nr:DUF4850 domain-containing protein [Gorillibacterium massiliense]